MTKHTYFDNQYTLCHFPRKQPELRYQDVTFKLTPEGTIHLKKSSKEFVSTANLFENIQYWKDLQYCKNMHHEYIDTLIGIEIANAMTEVMLYSGVRFPNFMTEPYYDFINASLAYFNIDSYFWLNPFINKQLRPYLTKNTTSDEYISPLEQLGIPAELTLPVTFSIRDGAYYMAIFLPNEGFLELHYHFQVAEMPDNKMKLHSFYRKLCNLLYHSGYTLTEDGKLYSNQYYILQDDHKVLLEKLLQKMKEC